MDKKRKERVIFEMVYDESAFSFVHQQESPDIVLAYRSVPAPFGVEITELYYSESEARLHNLPSYAQEILDGKPHRHRKDIELLQVSRATLLSSEGIVKARDLPIIIREMPLPQAYSEILAQIISDKGRRSTIYQSGLRHVNLIIMDRENRYRQNPPEEIFSIICTPTLLDVLAQTEFREVFLVTKAKPERRIYIPLKCTLLLSELYYFNAARCAFDLEAQPRFVDSELQLFAQFANATRGIPVRLTSSPEFGLFATLGNTSVRVSQGGKVDIFDHADFPAPPPCQENAQTPSPLDNRFIEFYSSYRANHVFVANLFSDIRREAFKSPDEEAFFES
jgi:hypothetical protein